MAANNRLCTDRTVQVMIRKQPIVYAAIHVRDSRGHVIDTGDTRFGTKWKTRGD